ncbi:MAG: Fibronectin type III domain protein [Syntrophorhabdus sp. PtaU1.Bin153]|nr:MAG: Fibronectin type III domain protein [Syntrophorhabdus sp. PtaU1.Bin153]
MVTGTRSIRSHFVLLFLLSYLGIMFFAGAGNTADVTLAWNANTESTLAGYRIYYGTVSGNYTSNIDVGNVTTFTVTGLNDGVTYYFAATAYDTSRIESAYSNEVVKASTTTDTGSGSTTTDTGSGSTTTDTVASGSVLYAYFGSSGIWAWNGSTWSQISPSDPQSMVVSGSLLYVDFGSSGTWRWNGSTWSQISPSDPQSMVVSD